MVHVFAMWCSFLVEAACPSPAACHCGGMVDGAVLSSVHWSDAPVTPDPVRRGSSCCLAQGMVRTADDVPVVVC